MIPEYCIFLTKDAVFPHQTGTILAASSHEVRVINTPARENLRYPPTKTARWWINRAELLAQILPAGKSQFTYLAAGPGFGKSGLLTQALDETSRQRLCAISYTVGRADRDIKTFAKNLGMAFRVAGIALEDLSSAGLEALGSTSPLDEVPTFDGLPPSLCLLLDDYHLGRSPASDLLLARLFFSGRPTPRIIVASRTQPSLALLRLTEHGHFVALGEDDLRFTDAEARDIFSSADTTDREVGGLLQKAKGWPVAISAVRACVLKKTPRAPGQVESHVMEDLRSYVGNCVAPSIPANQWSFIESVSVVSTFSARLAQQLFPKEDATVLIRELVDSTFLRSTTDPVPEFHFDDMFREIVRTTLKATSPAQHDSLVQQSATWYVTNRNWPEMRAVAASAINPLVLQDTIERAGGWILPMCFGNQVFDVVACAQVEDISKHYPRLALAKTIQLARSGLTQEARNLFERIAHQVYPSFDQNVWRAELAINAVRLEVFADKSLNQEMLEPLERVMDADLGDKPVLYAVAASILCDSHYQLGNYKKSHEMGLRAIVLCEHYDAPYAASYCYAFSAMAEFRLGNLAQARELLLRMREHVNRHFDAHSSLHDVAAVLLGCVLYEEGNLDEAEKLLDRPLGEVVAHEGLLEVAAAGFLTASLIATQRRDFDRALLILEAAEKAGAGRGFLRLCQLAQCRAMYLMTILGRISEAENIAALDTFPSDAYRLHDEPWRDYVSTALLLAQASLHLATGDHAKALARLDDYLLRNHGRHNAPCFARVVCLKLVATIGIGGSPEDVAAIIRTIFLYVEKLGYISPLMETVPLIPSLERCAKWVDFPSDARQLAAKLHARLQQSPLHVADRAPSISLSPRQQQILCLLKEGLSNKEIGTRLALAEGTVKSYRKMLYQKLGISRRSQAVAHAQLHS